METTFHRWRPRLVVLVALALIASAGVCALVEDAHETAGLGSCPASLAASGIGCEATALRESPERVVAARAGHDSPASPEPHAPPPKV